MMERASKDMAGVYELKVIPTQQRFIGSTPSLQNKFRNHLMQLQAGVHPLGVLQDAWNVHGPANVSFSILEIVQNRYSLPQRELHWIEQSKGIQIEGKSRDELHLPHSVNGYISASKEIKQKLRSMNVGPMTQALWKLVQFYEAHSQQ